MNFYKYHQGITIYPETPRRGSIVHPTHYEPLRDELVQYGREILPMHSFFDQLNILFQRTPKIAIRHFPPADNAEYCEGVGRGAKNCYLSVGACIDTEDVFYSLEVKEQCSAVFDSIMVWDSCTQIYQSNAVFRSYQVFYSSLITNSYDIRFSSNLTGCSECILCHDLQNQHYCIQNTPYTKDVYMQKKQEILSQKHKFLSMKQELTVVPTILSHACVGNMVIECEDVEDAWYAYRVRNSKNIFLAGTAQGNQEMINVSTSGAPDFEHICNVINGGGGHHIYSCDYVLSSSYCYYSYFLENCSFCLGCIGLKNKSYCILNKQYSKEERYEKVDAIFAQMEQEGTLGQFFPASMNPFYFNDTAAYLIDPTFTKEEVTALGYLRRDEPIKVDIPEGVEIVGTQDLSDYEGWEIDGGFIPVDRFDVEALKRGNVEAKRYIDPAILKKVIQDEQGNYYRIIPMEYKFLMKHGLPLPRKHWLERMKENFRIT